MAFGNERPRDETAKPKGTRSLTALGQSLRRGLTTKRSQNGAANKQHHGHHLTPGDTTGYTPSPLSRGTTGGSSDMASSVFGTVRPHRVGGASAGTMSSASASNSGSLRKTIYGSKGIATIGVSSGSSGSTGSSSNSSSNNNYHHHNNNHHSSSGTLHNAYGGSAGPAAATHGPISHHSLNGGSGAGGGSNGGSGHGGGGGGRRGHHQAPNLVDLFANPLANGSGPDMSQVDMSASSAGANTAHGGRSDFSPKAAVQSTRSSSGAPNMITKEGYLSKKTDINPSTSIASALSRGWKVYRVVLKGAKLFFYKPPSESELRAMFPEEIAAAENESAGGYTRPSMSTVFDEGHGGGGGSGMPLTPGEVDSGSRAILFEPGVHDGQITEPLCDRYLFGECFTEVDLRTLKFKRYVCVLIFDDTLVVLKRRWVRQGIASSFFGAVSNKMRFGKGSRLKQPQHHNADNSSLVSAELGIQGKGYFTKWKHHASYSITNAEAIEAASSRFSINHSPGVLGHLAQNSQTSSGRVSLYSIGNSSVSSVMTRTSTVSKDYSGALSSGVVPGFQIFVGGKERVARMFVATTSDAKNNWLSRFAAAKASYARRLRHRPRENINQRRGYESSRRPTATGTAGVGTGTDLSGSGGVGSGSGGKGGHHADTANAEDRAGGKPAKDTRTRLYWGTQRHPELVVVPASSGVSGSDDPTDDVVVVVGGSKSALVHEMVFCTARPQTTDATVQTPFSLQLAGTYQNVMTTDEFLRELQRYSELLIPELERYNELVDNLASIITTLASIYSSAFEAGQIDALRAIVAKTIASDQAHARTAENLNTAINCMVPFVATTTATTTAGTGAAHGPKSAEAPTSAGSKGFDPPKTPTTPVAKLSSLAEGSSPLRVRSKTHHAEPEPTVPQIPTVPELMRVVITGLSPSLLLKVSPQEFAHQLYLFHNEQLAAFDPKQAELYKPVARRRRPTGNAPPTPSLLTVGAANGDVDAAGSAPSPLSPMAGHGFDNSSGGVVSATAPQSSVSEAAGADTVLEMQRQLMVFTQSDPHFITRLVHQHLLVELPLNRPARRSALLLHWVRIGESCRLIGDAVGWAAIAMAVTMSPIARLRETWHGIALSWKELIVSTWVPLLVEYGIYETDIDSPKGKAPAGKALIIKPQSGMANNYSYAAIPYYGPIRMHVDRIGRKLRRQYGPVIATSNGGDAASGDKALFVHHGLMFAAAKEAVDSIPSNVLERTRSVLRSRASTISLAVSSQQQQGGSPPITIPQVSTDLALLAHPYLHEYLVNMALNPMLIGDELVESDVIEYDVRFLLSISLQCEPSVADQYQQHLQDGDEDSQDRATAASALRQAPGSILPLVCPEIVPSTNILQWITPVTRTHTPQIPVHTINRSQNGSGRSGTISHIIPSSPGIPGGRLMMPDSPITRSQPTSNSLALSGPMGGPSAMAGKRKPSGGPDSSAIENASIGAISQPIDPQGLRHKRSRSFPTNTMNIQNSEAHSESMAVPSTAGGDLVSAGSEKQSHPTASMMGSASEESSQSNSSTADYPSIGAVTASDVSHNDLLYAGATVYAAHGDLALKVLRVQYTHVRDSAALVQPVGFVVEVQGGTIPMLLDLLINGVEQHSATLAGEKGLRVQFPDGSTPQLLFNRDVFQRAFMASFRHFCIGFDVLDAMRKALTTATKRRSWQQIQQTLSTLLDITENWLGQHFTDFLDGTALREAMTDFLVSLEAEVQAAKPSDDAGVNVATAWGELAERSSVLLPELISQMLSPSGYTELEQILERRLQYAVKRERKDSMRGVDMMVQSPLSLLSLSEPHEVLESLNRLVQTHFAHCSFNDWIVAFCLLEVQTHAPLPWYAKKRITQVPSEDDIVVSDIYQVLEQTQRQRVSAQAHDVSTSMSGVGVGVGVGSVATNTAETSLVRTMPHSIQVMLELHRTIRGWVIRQIVDPSIPLSQRIIRIQKYLAIVRMCRRDSQLSASRVFGDLLNGYMREAGMIPERQPSYRVNSIKNGAYGRGSAGVGPAGKRGKRKAAQSQVRYVPSFVERAIASALVSPESRQYVRAWNEVALANNTKLESLEAMLRGARDPVPAAKSSSMASANGGAAAGAEELSQQKILSRRRSYSNLPGDEIDLSEDTMARADCFVPCLGWLLENLVSLCYDTPDTLVGDVRLVNIAKRHRVFIMLCVCDQLGRRCQEAFALPTKTRIDIGLLSNQVAQTPISFNEIQAQSYRESNMAAEAPATPSAVQSSSVASPSAATGLAAFGSEASFSFTASAGGSGSGAPAPSANQTLRSSETAPSSMRHAAGGFSKRSMGNLRGANDPRGQYLRKASNVTNLVTHPTPDLPGGNVFGSPPAPMPRSLSQPDSPSVHQPGFGASANSIGPISAPMQYFRPFARLVTDEVEKVRQEVREREKLERELRDREQAMERQKQERTKMLKRQLKEQQQRRAKNEPLLKMSNLMSKVGITVRDSSVDGNAAHKAAMRHTAVAGSAPLAGTDSGNRDSQMSTSSSMRPRGPALPSAKPANVINLINSTITVEEGYTKRDFVFRIVTEEGGQYLLQAPDMEQMEDWINGMRDAATEAAARRLTLFVEEAKKRSHGDSGSSSSASAAPSVPGMGNESDASQQPAPKSPLTETTARSRFTAFLGGSGGFGGFSSSSSSSMPPMPMRSALSVVQPNGKDLPANIDPKTFGIDLAKLMPDPKVVPVAVDKCLSEIERRGLEEVGIYRVSGAAADVSRLRQLFNFAPEAVDLSADEFYDINVVSGVMKQFLRELPEPLMTYNLYDGFVNAASIDDYDERLWAIKDLVHALPTCNYTVLKRLVEHLERVTDYEEINHMYGTNLALVFGPSLLRPPPGSSSFAVAMSNLGHAQSVIKNLILQYHWIFDVEEEAEPIEDAELEEGDEGAAETQPQLEEEVVATANSEASPGSKTGALALDLQSTTEMDQLADAIDKLTM